MTETKTVVGFLLENMLQLINSDNELILKAYEEKVVIEKEQIKSLYEYMQFLHNFLKDSEKEQDEHEEQLKSIVVKIRDISYRAEDIMDWFVLNVVLQQRDENITDDLPLYLSSSKCIVHLAQKFSDCLKPLRTGVDSIKECEKEMMGILSWLESHMADKIHCHYGGYGGVVEEIKSTIKEVMEIKLFKEADMLTLRLFIRVICQAKRIKFQRDSSPSEAGVTVYQQGVRLIRPQFCDYSLFFSIFNKMVDQTQKSHDVIVRLTEKIEHINAEVVKIYEMGLSVTWLDSSTTRQFSFLLRLSRKMVYQAKKIFHKVGVITEEAKPIKIEAMKIYEKGLRLSSPVAADQIRQGFETVTKEIKFIKREVMHIYKKKTYGITVSQVRKSSHGALSKPTSSIVKEDIIVGFDDEATMIIELLTGEHEKQLKIIPIIGMPGLGKTTLAMKVYNDPFIEYYFHIRAWTYVSQVYQRRELILQHFKFSRYSA